jgi:hypothetical protein
VCSLCRVTLVHVCCFGGKFLVVMPGASLCNNLAAYLTQADKPHVVQTLRHDWGDSLSCAGSLGAHHHYYYRQTLALTVAQIVTNKLCTRLQAVPAHLRIIQGTMVHSGRSVM